MKNHTFITIFMVATLCLSQGAAIAKPGHDRGHGNEDWGHCDNGRKGCGDEDNRRGPPGHGHSHRDDEQGAGPERSFYRGDRLPYGYRTHQYVVEDWRGHGLRTPPRGYHWVQTGSDYVLVAITTGVILELLLNH